MAEFDVFRVDRPPNNVWGWGGTAVFCRKCLDPINMDFPWIGALGIEGSAVMANRLFVGNKKVLIISIYRPPNVILGRRNWEVFFANLGDYYSDFSLLICGDLNAYHPSWGSSIRNREGQVMAELLLLLDLLCLNDGSITRVALNRNIHSVPDLSICTADLGSLYGWRVLDDPMGSDHLPISIQINLEASSPHLPGNFHRPKLVTSKLNKDLFIKRIDASTKALDEGTFGKGSDLFSKCHDLILDLLPEIGCLYSK